MYLERNLFRSFDSYVNDRQRVLIYDTFYRLSKNLYDNLLDFDTIIVDDASGRLVGLFTWHLVNLARNDNDLSPARIIFIAGGRDITDDREQNISTFFQHQNIQNALLVTEYASSGQSIQKLKQILENNQIPVQTAALSTNPGNHTIMDKVDYCGDFYDNVSLYFKSLKINGVTKTKYSPEIHCSPNYFNPKMVRQSRKEIKHLAQHIYQKLQEK